MIVIAAVNCLPLLKLTYVLWLHYSSDRGPAIEPDLYRYYASAEEKPAERLVGVGNDKGRQGGLNYLNVVPLLE